jgi:hypothetical protein
MNWNIILPSLITSLIFLLRLPIARNVFAQGWAKLPKWAQPALPIMLGIWTRAVLGWDSGLTGEALLVSSLEGWQDGALAIALWHTVKRIQWKKAAPVITMFAFLCLNQCSSMKTTIGKILVVENQVQTYAMQLKVTGDNIIAMLPADNQAKARADFEASYLALTDSLEALNLGLNAALADSAKEVDLVRLTNAVLNAADSIASLLKTFGVIGAPLERLDRATYGLKLSASGL